MSQIYPPVSIRELIADKLTIPNYQRPYKWKVKHVLNLISDLDYERKKKYSEDSDYRYRIGSVILHKEDDVMNIVDGQQRLLTICLILSVIAPYEIEGCTLFKKKYTDKITLDNLSYNREHIEMHFNNYSADDKDAFATYLLDGCEVIIIKASNIAEAFQLFDSQNARGKSLEPADLLKAFHLRAMDDEHTKRMCVRRWEEAIDRKLLYPVLSRVIYRCRRWMRRDYEAYDFGNDVIDEFKGVNSDIFKLNETVLPYMRRLYVISQIESFSVDEPISNGKRFFDYVDHYVAMFEKLFPGVGDFKTNYDREKLKHDNDYQDLVRRHCFYTPKMYRVGDSRLRNVLYCLLMAYYDKFGDMGYAEFFRVVYQYVYQVRLELGQIRRESIRDYVLQGRVPGDKQLYANRKNPFEWIADSYEANPSELRTKLRQGVMFSLEDLNTNVRKG